MHFTNSEHHNFAKDPAVVSFGGRYLLYHSIRHSDGRFGIGIAESTDLEQWRVCGEIEAKEKYEKNGMAAPGAIVLGNRIHLFYQTYGNGKDDAICHAYSSDGFLFTRDSGNPVFSPVGAWNCGRAIDADVCIFQGRLYLYFATRDSEMKIQKVGGAWAELDSTFGKGSWTQLGRKALLEPELPWEGECIEAPATIVHAGKAYMFYGGSYNCTPQQIGCAISEDGVNFTRIFHEPFLRCGDRESWNSSESGHPFVFRDDDGQVYLFYQGSNDGGETWYISKERIEFINEKPLLIC